MNQEGRRGFTLIELLVVVSIISLLSSIILTSLSEARTRARDIQRLAQAKQFVRALQIYYTTYGKFPCSGPACAISVNLFRQSTAAPQALIAAGAISGVPDDPVYTTGTCASGGGYCYCTDAADSYVLTVNTENDNGGSDRCYLKEGPATATICVGHQTLATESCDDRF